MNVKLYLKNFIPFGLLQLRRNFINKTYSKTTKRYLTKYLNTHEVKKLQLGAATNYLDGWFNTDLFTIEKKSIYYLNVSEKFPIAASTFDYIFCEELIEHIDYQSGSKMLEECIRILKPGGKIRIATPNLENFINMYKNGSTEIEKDYTNWTVDKFLPGINKYKEIFVINNLFRNWGHQFIYDYETLKELLEDSGFINITKHNEGESEDINLRQIDKHTEISGSKRFRNFESIFLEAVKPSN